MPTQEQQEVFNKYLPIVSRIVGGFQKKLPRNVLREDLMAAGMIGLWDAVRRHKGNDDQFEWYARVRIRGAILDELRAQDWLPRRGRLANWLLTDDSSIGVDRLEDFSESQKSKALAVEPVECISEEAQKVKALRMAIRRLPKREQTIVAMHLSGIKFKQIAEKLGVSEPRISQLHTRAVEQLKVFLCQA